jgi:hypothetical protein
VGLDDRVTDCVTLGVRVPDAERVLLEVRVPERVPLLVTLGVTA